MRAGLLSSFSAIAAETGKVFYEIDTLPVVVDGRRLKDDIAESRVGILDHHLVESLSLLEPQAPDCLHAAIA